MKYAAGGASPSVQQVRVPQNGPQPAFLEKGNQITLDVREPCTQLVTLDAVVKGQRLSTSVLFSTVLDTSEVLKRRLPLPPDAVWGVPIIPNTRSTELREFGVSAEREVASRTPHNDQRQIIDSAKRKADTLNPTVNEQHGPSVASYNPASVRPLSSNVGERIEAERQTAQAREPPAGYAKLQAGGIAVRNPHVTAAQVRQKPLSLLFVGSLAFDGQKSVWLQQMEDLPRQRFSPTYMTFQEGDQGDKLATPASHSGGILEERLQRAGVPLVVVTAPRLEGDWSEIERFMGKRGRDEIHVEGSQNPNLREGAFSAVLESFDEAKGDPALMSPSWARDMFFFIGQAVAKVSPDVLIIGNAKTLGDAVLTQAARWAMGPSGRVIMDFPNIDPAPGITADVLAAPSHYVARHSTTEALATAAGAHVVVIPPGVSTDERSWSTSKFASAGNEKMSGGERGALCHPAYQDGVAGGWGRCDPTCKAS